MEHKTETNHILEQKKRKKKVVHFYNQLHQVTPKLVDDQKKNIIMTKCHLKIDPCASSSKSIIPSTFNSKSTLRVDNAPQNSEQKKKASKTIQKKHSTSSQLLKQNNSFKIDENKCNNDMVSIKNEVLNSYLDINNLKNMKIKNLIQFEKCEDTDLLRCSFCHCLFCQDLSILDQHQQTKCSMPIESIVKYIQQFVCFICDKIEKSFKDWKLHVTSNTHLGKCMVKNDNVSYNCGGCKAVFYGNKDQILNHCKDVHHDPSGLPSIFKCLQEMFYEFIFKNPGNWKYWSFCGPCKKYSPVKINCFSPNHINKKTKKFKCNSCLIDFICSQDVYNKHLMSCEHIMMEHLRVDTEEKSEHQVVCNLKLPPIFLNKFTINDEKATCNDCKFQMESNETAISIHLTDCINFKSKKGCYIKTKVEKYFCSVCEEIIPDFRQWKLHLVLSSHLINCHDINDLVSYTCEICLLHCYGKVHHVVEHQYIHPNSSEKNLSTFLALNFQRINKDFSCKEYYYCEDCESYAEVNLNSDHWNKSHKTKLKRMDCQPCRTQFFCIEENNLFEKHTLSSEHIILTYTIKNPLPDYRKPIEVKYEKLSLLNNVGKKSLKNSSENQKTLLSFNIQPYLNWFKSIKDQNNAICKHCNELIFMDENDLLGHMLVCYQNSTKNIPEININYFQCLDCVFNSNNYDSWAKHAILHVKLNNDSSNSYFCKVCSTLLYGKLNDIELHLKNEHEIINLDLPLESELMKKQLMKRKNNTGKSTGIMCFCDSCNKVFKKIDNDKHFNANSHVLEASDFIELFYCKYCEIELYSTSTVNERHKLTVEHIILSSESNIVDVNTSLKSLKLDAHLIKYVTNQKLYDNISNIGFFCFICDYLCTDLKIWKTHINGKKHNNLSQKSCLDHRCKICKILMFGRQHHMFEHYDNCFHSMLKQFKLTISTDNVKKNDLMFQKKLNSKLMSNVETLENNDLSAPKNIKKTIPEKSITDIDKIHQLTKLKEQLPLSSNTQQDCSILSGSTTNSNDIHSTTETNSKCVLELNQDSISGESTTNIKDNSPFTKFMEKWSSQYNNLKECNMPDESTSNINGTPSVPKATDLLSLKLNAEQNIISGVLNNSLTSINKTHSLTELMDELSLETSTQQDSSYRGESTANINETYSIKKNVNDFPLETDNSNYSRFYGMKIKMLNQNKEIIPQKVYYCQPCDFITSIQKTWDEHNSSDHLNENEVRHQVFCRICNLCQFGSSENLNEHIKTNEHNNMLHFQNLNNTKKINDKEKRGDLKSIKPSDAVSTSKTDTQEKNNVKKDENEVTQRRVLVEIKDIKSQYKKNGWVELKKIFSTYGYFAIYPKHNHVLIMFRKLSSLNQMLKERAQLESLHEFSISVLFEDEKVLELNKTTEYEFGNKEILLKAINAQLKAINQEITHPNISNRLTLLMNSIYRCGGQLFYCSRTYPFGSRMSGLAVKESDVDLYYDIGYTFNGSLSNDLNAQEDLVRYFGKVFRSLNNEFKQVQQITGARVPIVKFFHIPSGLNCDLSFKSGLSTHNTKLVRLYLSLDDRVHWIVCAVVKRWALQNDLKNQSMFTSYGLAWLVLFYLMTIKVVPPLKLLRENASATDMMFIEDWDCTFCSIEKAKQIWKVPEVPCWDLLFGFFNFYSNPNRLKQFVFCPAIGKAISKDEFIDIPKNSPDILGFHKKKTGDVSQWCIKIRSNFYGEGLAVQDPFDLFHNITKTIVPRKLQNFSQLCDKTEVVMRNGTQPYYA